MAETETKQQPNSNPASPSKSPNPTPSNKTAFTFWFYFTIAVSLLTLLFLSLLPLPSSHPNSWFLTLPQPLRRHYSAGKLIKLNSPTGGPPIHTFAVDLPGAGNSHTILLLHGLGSSSYSFRHLLPLFSSAGYRTVAVDLPGAGFSDDLTFPNRDGFFNAILTVYEEIRDKGLFSGFDRLIETGEIREKPPIVRVSVDSGYGSVVMGEILGQIVDVLDLGQIHLVLHDSALLVGANWVLGNNKKLVSSLTIVDGSPRSAAFPAGLLDFPVLGRVVLGSKRVFAWLLRLCCVRILSELDAEAYRLVLKRKNGGGAAGWRFLNRSLDVGEWLNSEELKGLPVQILWSNSLSDRWIDEGRRMAAEIPRAEFCFHSGGRWPQEDAAEEIGELITKFVSSLPKSVRRMEEDTVPDHIQKMFDEASHQVHHHYDHSHGQNHELPYMGMYGLDHG